MLITEITLQWWRMHVHQYVYNMFVLTYYFHFIFKILKHSFSLTGKGKAIPLQALTGPEVSRRLRLLDFKTIGT
jgi:hypothetical protein